MTSPQFKLAIENQGTLDALLVNANYNEFRVIFQRIQNSAIVGNLASSITPWIRNHGFVWGSESTDTGKKYHVSINKADGRGENLWQHLGRNPLSGIEIEYLNQEVYNWVHSGNAMIIPNLKTQKPTLIVGINDYAKITSEFIDSVGKDFDLDVLPLCDSALYIILKDAGYSVQDYFYDLDTLVFPCPDKGIAFVAYPFDSCYEDKSKFDFTRAMSNTSEAILGFMGYAVIQLPFATFSFHERDAIVDGEPMELSRFSSDLYSPTNVVDARTSPEVLFLMKHYSPVLSAQVEQIYRETIRCEVVSLEPGYLISEQMGARCGTITLNS